MSAPPVVEVDDGLLRQWPLPPTEPDGDKETRGRALVIAGSRETPGAALLAGRAALRAGCGKLLLAVPATVAVALGVQLPEARVVALPETAGGGLAAHGVALLGDAIEQADALLVGPGLQDETGSRAFVAAVLACSLAAECRVILDALAMRLAAWPLDRAALVTPHAGEMARMCGIPKEQVRANARRAAGDLAARCNAVVALKGAATWIAAPDGRTWRHEAEIPALAVSGSGDVLAGLMAGLAARGASLEQAAVWGVALHARAGAALAADHGPLGGLASELPAGVPRLMHQLSVPG